MASSTSSTPPESHHHQPKQPDEGRRFHPHRHESGDRGGRALVHIRSPHVKRHGGDLERKTDAHQQNTDAQQRRAHHGIARRGEQRPEVDQRDGAGHAVNHRDPKQEKAGREGPHQEVFERGFNGTPLVGAKAGQGVHRDRHGFEADEERDEVAGHHHDHHRDDREDDQRVVFTMVVARLARVGRREQDRHDAGRDDQHGPRTGEIIDENRRRALTCSEQVPGG